MAALQYVHVTGYSAILFRRTFPQLSQPNALIPRSKQWLMGTDARYNQQEHRWTFPTGATLTFGHLQHTDDIYNYQGAEYQFIGFDELTQFEESQYTYLISRLRRVEGFEVPLRVRAASNPGGVGHEWVRDRFDVLHTGDGKRFVPAGLDDNPHLDIEEYQKALEQLDPITRKQLREGDWEVRGGGDKFQRGWFDIIEEEDLPWNPQWVRAWDTAATPKTPTNDPDWTAGLLMAYKDGYFYIVDVRRTRAHTGDVEKFVLQTMTEDGGKTATRMGQEPGSSGEHMIHDYAKKFKGYDFMGVKETGKKWIRANPVAAAAYNRLIKVVRGSWNRAFFDELEAFREDEKEYAHDDQVDALSMAFNYLANNRLSTGPIKLGGSEPGGRAAKYNPSNPVKDMNRKNPYKH
jgi:predicted phage terminase large subunit-like protein